MQYDLDPRLLPPAGASVQCTRCSFVFTAMPSGEVLVAGQGQQPPGSRTPVGTSTRVFGRPDMGASTPAAPKTKTETTQIFGSVRPPAPTPQATPASGTAFPAAGKTQVFGAVSAPPQSPSASTTQVFGAAAVAAKASPATSTQVFGAPPASPPPAAAPPATTTQVFGAVQLPAPLPPAATTQAFGSAQVQAARKAKEPVAPAPGPEGGAVSWMVEPGPAPAAVPLPAPLVPRSVTAERQARVPPPPPSLELPAEEPVPLPEPVHVPVPPPPPPARRPVEERSEPLPPSRRSASVELPPELRLPERQMSTRSAPEQAASSGGKERLLLVLAAVVALGLTAWLSYPVWRNQGSELPADAVSAQDDAASLLRRDDAASRAQAIEKLTALTARYPKFTQAQAELTVALALQLDDVKVDLAWVQQEEKRLQEEITQLEQAQSRADWAGQVAVRKRELITLGTQRQPLETMARNLKKNLEQVLTVIRAAPETEPAADVAARLKAQALAESINGSAQAAALVERLGKLESPPHWSVIALAEYGLNAQAPTPAQEQAAEALAQLRSRDQTFLRAYVLGARLALLRGDAATARSLLDTVLALNSNHALARSLQKRASAAASKP